ncbi:ornithine carbamoyltransferase [Leucothrix sargassi]|nr:ornithine carbamoyltransferase [Leucothrix sargassi]
MNLLDINDLTKDDIHQIWNSVSDTTPQGLVGNIAWSFEGNGIRTRTTFIQAFQKLGLPYVELPNFLKTGEPVNDLAGYMDPFYSMYILRDNNHDRMSEFALATNKPVINAMSSKAHPCEVLTDAYYLQSKHGSLQELKILLWGPITNVFKSWHSLSEVLGLNVTHFCPREQHTSNRFVNYSDDINDTFDVVITDAWPTGFSDKTYSLTQDRLRELGSPELLPTPPATLGNEVMFSPASYDHFSGYAQKGLLLPVQQSIITHLLRNNVE